MPTRPTARRSRRCETAWSAACSSASRGACVNGPTDPDRRLWNTTNIALPGVDAEIMLLTLAELGVCASAGSACSSGSLEPSPVLCAMGLDKRKAAGSLRLSLSRFTTEQEIDRAIEAIDQAYQAVSASV
ncbi:MAG: hypothetical protein KatS3mg103_1094 [Phycisphaerales bacterium]|nr:MAG: hypothetical protein KatS3mg103_1094 [Phycisphaerales bacterium]